MSTGTTVKDLSRKHDELIEQLKPAPKKVVTPIRQTPKSELQNATGVRAELHTEADGGLSLHNNLREKFQFTDFRARLEDEKDLEAKSLRLVLQLEDEEEAAAAAMAVTPAYTIQRPKPRVDQEKISSELALQLQREEDEEASLRLALQLSRQ